MPEDKVETVIWINRNPKEEAVYNPHSAGDGLGREGCECCSLLFGAFSLTGLVAVGVPMLIYTLKKGRDDEPR